MSNKPKDVETFKMRVIVDDKIVDDCIKLRIDCYFNKKIISKNEVTDLVHNFNEELEIMFGKGKVER